MVLNFDIAIVIDSHEPNAAIASIYSSCVHLIFKIGGVVVIDCSDPDAHIEIG